ncbi:MAG: glycine cleavage system aminomethyltransferase GcvT [Chlamydiia bacterium]|nr:glycine cleavage system aminomethyltransferase GcvT [Chlamydiia bacterium]
MMKSPLHTRHLNLGAKMVDFAGWQMPLSYTGVVDEHLAVREAAGLFDVSHMGRVVIEGKDALPFLDYLSTNKIRGNGIATYTCWCNEAGGVVDDLIVYRESPTNFFVILNASRKEADLQHMRAQAQRFDVKITPVFQDEGILAYQGPSARSYAGALKPMRFENRGNLIVAATGYTGSGGVEIFGPKEAIVKIWDELIEQGVKPVGLGARDTLRLGKGYALYGHELSETISPLESVSAWTVSLEKEFLGKAGIKGKGRRAYGLKMEEGGIPREGYVVLKNNREIGFVTSGGFSPSLKIPIALILSNEPLDQGESIEIIIRDKPRKGVIAPLPFEET